VFEIFLPVMYMSRMIDPYSAGYGRFRSGHSVPTMELLHRMGQGIGSGAIGCAHDRILPNLGLFGGYPGGKRNTFLVRYHDFAALVEKRLPLIHEIGDPRTFLDQPHAEVMALPHMPPTIEVRDKDLLVVDNSSAGGLGDPLDRDPAMVKADLEEGLSCEDIARRIYGVAVRYDERAKEWTVDEEETERLRRERRRERLARAVPVRQWWLKARERVARKDLDPLLCEMYHSSMKMSPSFARAFREFWALPEDFSF